MRDALSSHRRRRVPPGRGCVGFLMRRDTDVEEACTPAGSRPDLEERKRASTGHPNVRGAEASAASVMHATPAGSLNAGDRLPAGSGPTGSGRTHVQLDRPYAHRR
jgi:hypothetical protein